MIIKTTWNMFKRILSTTIVIFSYPKLLSFCVLTFIKWRLNTELLANTLRNIVFRLKKAVHRYWKLIKKTNKTCFCNLYMLWNVRASGKKGATAPVLRSSRNERHPINYRHCLRSLQLISDKIQIIRFYLLIIIIWYILKKIKTL
jgi:hypothetical protein